MKVALPLLSMLAMALWFTVSGMPFTVLAREFGAQE